MDAAGNEETMMPRHRSMTPARRIRTRCVVVRELTIRRENDDRDTLHLCDDCASSIADYCAVLKRKKIAGRCERCEA